MSQIIIHIGAHRCASTAIQLLLKANRKPLKKAGYDLWFRGPKKHDADFRTLNALYQYNSLNPFMARRVSGLAKRLSAEGKLIISEENILGRMVGVKDHSLYAGSANLFKRFATVRKKMKADLRLVMMLRPQDSLIESLYAFRVTRGERCSFNDFVSRLDLDSFSYDRILSDAARAGVDDCLHVGQVSDLSVDHVSDLFGLELEGELAGNASLSPANVNLFRAMVCMGLNLSVGPACRDVIFFLRENKNWPDMGELAQVFAKAGLAAPMDQLSMAYDLAHSYELPVFEGSKRAELMARFK